MTNFYLDNHIPEAVLEIDNTDQQTLYSQARWKMFIHELRNAETIVTSGSTMVESIITKAKTEIKEEKNKSYDKCHVKTYVKTGGGGGGFKNSYEKNCR